ncbi:MAG: SPFH domain-containing protein, partial [Roseiarcus sp.]
MISRARLVVAALIALAIFVLASSLYVVGEGEQALLVRLGAPIGVAATPGLKFKAPFIDSVTVYDTRLLLLEPPTEQMILGDQKRLEVQSYT